MSKGVSPFDGFWLLFSIEKKLAHKGSRKIKALAEIFWEEEQRRSAGDSGVLSRNDRSIARCDDGVRNMIYFLKILLFIFERPKTNQKGRIGAAAPMDPGGPVPAAAAHPNFALAVMREAGQGARDIQGLPVKRGNGARRFHAVVHKRSLLCF